MISSRVTVSLGRRDGNNAVSNVAITNLVFNTLTCGSHSSRLGRIQYMTCAHYQDMEGWPSYWNGFPPLMHPTHAVAPCLMLAGHLPKRVYGRGSGKIRDELVAQYNSPFAFESALIELENSDLTIEMERFLYGVARSYSECFRIYGEKKSFEWQQLASESPVFYTRTGALREVETYKLDGDPERFFRGSEIKEERVEIPDFADRLPKEISPEQTEYISPAVIRICGKGSMGWRLWCSSSFS